MGNFEDKIKRILVNEEDYEKRIMEQYADSLQDISDLKGDNCDSFSLLFYLINHRYLRWLDNNPDVAVTIEDIELRRKIYKVLQKVGPKILGCTQVIENREFLNNPSSDKKDKELVLPDKPVIFAANHGFRDDVLATTLAANRHSYLYCGSLPLLYNTVEGFAVSLVGDVVVNRKSKNSRQASIDKVERVFDYNTDLIMFPEGGWNKKSEVLTNPLWKGIYDFSKIRNCDVVPIVHYVRDMEIVSKKNTIHTVVDDPIPLYEMSEKEALIYLRDIMSSWQYKMAEVYGKSTREVEMKGFNTSDEKWKKTLEDRMTGIPRYDKEIESKSDFRPKEIIQPECVFEQIANIENVNEKNIDSVIYAKSLIRERKESDFQHMF